MKNKLIALFVLFACLIVFVSYRAWINLILLVGVISLLIISFKSEKFLNIRDDYCYRLQSVDSPLDLIKITEGYDEQKSFEENCLSLQGRFKNKKEKEFFRYLANCSSLDKVSRLLYVYKDYGNISLTKYLSFGIFVGVYFLLIKIFSFYLNLLSDFFILVTIFLSILLFATIIDTSYLPNKFSFYHEILLRSIEEEEMTCLKEVTEKKKSKIYKEIVTNFNEGKRGEYFAPKSLQEKISSLYCLVNKKKFNPPQDNKLNWYYVITEYAVFILALILVIKGLLL